MMEYWKIGLTGDWNTGILEYWVSKHYSIIPPFHPSNFSTPPSNFLHSLRKINLFSETSFLHEKHKASEWGDGLSHPSPCRSAVASNPPLTYSAA